MSATAEALAPRTGEHIPAEFAAYWKALEGPGVKRQRALALRLFGFDAVPSEERVREFAHGCYDADPIDEAASVRRVRARA
jgi:hypothetical protein